MKRLPMVAALVVVAVYAVLIAVSPRPAGPTMWQRIDTATCAELETIAADPEWHKPAEDRLVELGC